eukprot:230120-Rhodomonas_salina.2
MASDTDDDVATIHEKKDEKLGDRLLVVFDMDRTMVGDLVRCCRSSSSFVGCLALEMLGCALSGSEMMSCALPGSDKGRAAGRYHCRTETTSKPTLNGRIGPRANTTG